ncbi:MAG TPA: MFS transporter [Acidimicrobiales bacterium]|nr:MFS transporter [Acidimicrobiales bacterium]
MALLAGLVLGTVFGVVEGFSLFSVSLARDLGINRGDSSAMYSVYLLACAGWAPSAGRIVDRCGSRRVILTAFPLLATGLASCAAVVAPWQLYGVYVLLIGPATTALIVASQVMVTGHYEVDRGKALGLAFACVGVGNLLLFSLLGIVVQGAGWRSAYLVAAAVGILVGIGFQRTERTEVAAAVAPGAEGEELASSPRAPFRRPAFWFLALTAIAAGVLDFVVFQHMVPYLLTVGYTESGASFMLGLASVGYFAGQLGTGVLSDRVGREPLALTAALLYALGLALLWQLPPTWAVGGVAVTLGVAIGGAIGCRSAAMGDLFAGAGLGRVVGLIQIAATVGAASATWLGGLVFDRTGGYGLTFSVATGCAGVMAVALWLAAPRTVRHQRAETVTDAPVAVI